MEHDERKLPTIRKIELQIWKITWSDASSTQLEACRFLLERIKAREVKARAEMNQGRGDDELPPDPIYR